MKEGSFEHAKTYQITIKEILNKKQFYENRMLQEKEATEHLISLCNQIHAELEEIYPMIDDLKRNEDIEPTIDLIDKFKHVEFLLRNTYLIYIENDLNMQNLEYLRLEIEDDMLKLQQSNNAIFNAFDQDILSSLGDI